MQFHNVIGQHSVKQHLLEMAQQNRLSHALLFLGKEGCGALPLALAFSQFISLLPAQKNNDESKDLFGNDESQANVVPVIVNSIDDWMKLQPGFTKAENYIHPDIHFSYPVIPRKTNEKPLSKDFLPEWREFLKLNPYGNVFDWLQFIGAENKQGNINAEECNEIIRKISLKSYESSYKILVMWMPEYLGQMGNKLLKLIEEPPGNTLFILVAENDENILPTLLSRCQLIKIPPVKVADIEDALITSANVTSEVARQTACIVEGNYREALQLIQHASEDSQSLLKQWLNAILKEGPSMQVKWIEELNKQGREKQKQFLRYFIHLLQQSIHLRTMKLETSNVPENEVDFAQKLNKITSVSQQQVIIEELNKAIFYIERNANAKMLFHSLTIKLYHIIQDKIVFLTD